MIHTQLFTLSCYTECKRRVTQNANVVLHRMQTSCYTECKRRVTQNANVVLHRMQTSCYTECKRRVTQNANVVLHRMQTSCYTECKRSQICCVVYHAHTFEVSSKKGCNLNVCVHMYTYTLFVEKLLPQCTYIYPSIAHNVLRSLTMPQLLDKLTVQAKVEAREGLRKSILSLNGLAGLYILKVEVIHESFMVNFMLCVACLIFLLYTSGEKHWRLTNRQSTCGGSTKRKRYAVKHLNKEHLWNIDNVLFSEASLIRRNLTHFKK